VTDTAGERAAVLEKLVVRPMEERDLPAASEVVRVAFDTFLGRSGPAGDKDAVRTRWTAQPEAALTAELDGELVGSNFATPWGSFGFFGPLTVRPELWDKGIASRLLESTDELFARWGTRHAGLFTFSHSPKHHFLYQKFGYWPKHLTSVFEKPVDGSRTRAGVRPAAKRRDAKTPEGRPATGAVGLTSVSPGELESAVRSARELTSDAYDGLDVEREIRAVVDQGLGEVLLLDDGAGAAALAVCQTGPGTEGGSGRCYVKFGMARGGGGAEERFHRLLDAVEDFAVSAGAEQIELGVNAARREAYAAVFARGYRAAMVGVAMERGDDDGYNRPGVWLIDDWR